MTEFPITNIVSNGDFANGFDGWDEESHLNFCGE